MCLYLSYTRGIISKIFDSKTVYLHPLIIKKTTPLQNNVRRRLSRISLCFQRPALESVTAAERSTTEDAGCVPRALREIQRKEAIFFTFI